MRALTLDVSELANRLGHVRWLGGASGAGKTTIAARLAAEFDLHVVSTDDAMSEHARRCLPSQTPALQAFLAMNMDERWVDRPADVMAQTFHWFLGEGFDLIVDDLLSSPPDTPVIVEGLRLLPRLVAPLLRDTRQAIWLLPTPSFRRRAFETRGSLMQIPDRTRDPPRALANLLERDRLFTQELGRETARLGLQVLEVDETLSLEAASGRVARDLGLT